MGSGFTVYRFGFRVSVFAVDSPRPGESTIMCFRQKVLRV